ncbi:chromate transporter [Niallia endozanthoxylica]|uniref:Chromate transporter n=1 Tax=Niallia endozanthoxylica TaxID=2036016 RepID=A0A5J5I0C6_9BACI|nr:chromate transporter [Niallia endozanthoxylica]KAA9028578.1 chromate transporter [Niallia endozanthoxylica]
MKLYRDIFVAFFRSGILGFGGGPSAIPLVHKEVVGTFKWMNDDQFSDVLALGNTLPGPINTKMAGYIGYRVGGITGLIVALTAAILPTVLLMLALLTSFNQFKDNPRVQGMTHAVVPIVGVMMGVLTWSFLKKAKSGLGWKKASLLLIGCLICIVFLGIHPGVVIGVLLAGAFVLPEKKNKIEVHAKGKSESL